MILCYCAGDYVKTHSVTLSAEVFRAGGSTQEWCHDEIYNYVRETMFRYLPAGDVKKTIEKNLDLDGDAKKVSDFAFIQSCVISMTTQKTLCKYANKQAVKVLFEKAKLDTILKLEVLGGDPSWTSEMINTVEDQDDNPVPIWSVLGPADISKLLHDWLRDMKAYADGIPEDEYYKYTYTGNRKLVAKNTDQLTLTVARSDKRKRGMADLDQTGQGVKESYQRKIELLRKAPYSAMDAESVIKQMLCAREGQAGEQGGALLASFVVLKKDDFQPIQKFGGVIGFLEANLDHYKEGDAPGTTSMATQVLMHAVKFANELLPLLAANAQEMDARAPIFQPPPGAPRQPRFEVRPAAHERSASYTAALPPRRNGQSSTPASRTGTRDSAMRLMQETGAAVGLEQARAEASTPMLLDVRSSDKARGSRGRMLGAEHLNAGLRKVTAQLRTSKLRTDFHSNDSVLVDDEVGSSDAGEGDGMGRRGVAITRRRSRRARWLQRFIWGRAASRHGTMPSWCRCRRARTTVVTRRCCACTSSRMGTTTGTHCPTRQLRFTTAKRRRRRS